MASNWVWVFLVMVLVSLEGWWSQGERCWDEERIALLQLKPFFNSTSPFPNLKSWVEGDENSDCCNWKRVECDITGRVIELDLSETKDYLSEEWYLNASLFSPFQQLESLYLSDNKIAGCLENEGFERLSRLSNLKYLYLVGNNFNNSILSSLVGLSSLKGLYLGYNNLKGSINIQGLRNLEKLDLGGNMLNNSVLSLSSLSSLRSLYLYNIGLKGSVDVEGLHSLSNLEVLGMGFNEIDKFVVPKDYGSAFKKLNRLYLWETKTADASVLLSSVLRSFPYLKTLDFGYHNFNRTMSTQELHNLTSNLEELFLDYSQLHLSFLQTVATCTSLKRLSMRNCELIRLSHIQGPLNFKNLEELVMDETTLNSSFRQIVGPMNSLKNLSLSYCGLNGSLLDQGLCDMVHLQKLNIENNDLLGPLPSCFANLTSLQQLDISSNHIIGDISLSPLKDLTSIQVLDISDNRFSIPNSFESLYNLSNLKEFNCQNNQIYVDTMSHSLTPKFQLNSIILSNYSDVGRFPKFFYHQHHLQLVVLSQSNLSRESVNWLLDNNTRLEVLCLVNNSLSSPFPLPSHPHMYLKKLDISINFFCGNIPVEIAENLPRLISLNISTNGFNGHIPSSFGDMKSLRILDLSDNRLSNTIPEYLARGCFSLELLDLSNNNLQGHIFSKNFNLTQLTRLQLDGNHFYGTIPEGLSNCSMLGGLYFSDNHLSGTIPGWLGNLSFLTDIIMPNNHIEGPLPKELCQLVILQILDFSGNNISGSLPTCFGQKYFPITQIHLSRNKLQGQLQEALFINSSALEILDLSYNHLKGFIPSWIDQLSSLGYLILSNNNLEGEMPIQLCKLSQLCLIDLSHNNLIGQIPPCLDNTSLHKEDGDDVITSDFGYYNPYYSKNGPQMGKEESIEFRTKSMSYHYKGRILTSMSGIDFSCNKLFGKIPDHIGNLTRIRALNLSHNNLAGSIPITFSNLKQIESLDLSYNKLNGKIPLQLVEIYTLSIFNMSYNNLSGEIPERIGQFSTFEESSYKGNPFLCGLPLNKSCNAIEPPSSTSRASSSEIKEDNCFIDIDIFYISFVVSYVIVLITIATILYVNPYWRCRWFYLVEIWMASCYYFFVDHLPRFHH